MVRYFTATCTLIVLLTAHVATAGDYSYLYFQGDKQTPFYVKVNGVMQPRYGKDYCIVPKLNAGEVEIELLFQQNLYPVETYHIQVPANCSRGFLLDRKDSSYALYDLNTRSYLKPEKIDLIK